MEGMHSEYPIQELVQIVDIDADGILPGICILGGDFITTFYRLMVPYGSNMPVRSPVVRVRRPRASFKPNVLHDLLLQAEFNLAESKPKRLMFRHN